MEITIKINGQAVSVEVSYEVYEYLSESDRRTENLSHQKRRHWDMREFDEYVIATECSHILLYTKNRKKTANKIGTRKGEFMELSYLKDLIFHFR